MPLRTGAILLFLLSSWPALAERIDRGRVLFGIEYTFQDPELLREIDQTDPNYPNLAIRQTPYKLGKIRELFGHYLRLSGIPESRTNQDLTVFKPGYAIVENDGQTSLLVMEPAVIEFAGKPLLYDQIESEGARIQQAAKLTRLKSYMLPAGQDSGGGHVHVGARTLGENPFFLYPNLLRNMMVYFHNHPSLLYGLADAFDVGADGSMESFHRPELQKSFSAAVAYFDQWYLGQSVDASTRQAYGATWFLKVLQHYDASLIHHDNFINLQHLAPVAGLPFDQALAARTGKLTVEFRTLRSPRSPRHAKAYADLLLHLMERLSEPGYLEPVQPISQEASDRYLTATKVQSDWQQVRAELGIRNPLLDAMVREYAKVSHGTPIALPGVPGAELYPAFSAREAKGHFFELRIPAKSKDTAPPVLQSNGKPLSFEKVKVGRKHFWVSYFEGAPEWIERKSVAPSTPLAPTCAESLARVASGA